jgi:membrane-bound lytic murein transglycosylase F
MQLMPGTAKTYGITMESPPEDQIRAGASFIKWLDDRFIEEIEGSQERAKFVLASYNIGLGHIQDARRLAEKYGDDPNVWHGSVDEWLLKKADPDYYTDQVVKYGYARGVETYNFVTEIMNRYEDYKNIMNQQVIASRKPLQGIR